MITLNNLSILISVGVIVVLDHEA